MGTHIYKHGSSMYLQDPQLHSELILVVAMSKGVTEYVKSSQACAHFKTTKDLLSGLLKPLPIP